MRALLALAIAASAAFSLPAHGQTRCWLFDEISQALEQTADEAQHGHGLMQNRQLLVLFVGPSGGWTLLRKTPRGLGCFVAAGEAWQDEPRGVRAGPSWGQLRWTWK